MGKHTDKMYLTASEWANEFGGAKKKAIDAGFKPLPFHCCALSLQPFDYPVSTQDGIIFDLVHIVPWIKKYGTNPITGDPLDPKSLFKLNWTKKDGDWIDPVTFKIFNSHTHIVAIKTTGNVYAYETVEKLNVKPKNYKDLLTDEPFTRKDIITLQDPHQIMNRNINDFYHLKNDLKVEESTETKESMISAIGTTTRVLNELAAKFEQPETSNSSGTAKKPYNAAHFSTGVAAASLTSTAFTPQPKNESATIDEEVYMFSKIKEKGYVTIKTNLGEINIELFCDETPKTCYNFISLVFNYFDKSIG